MHITKGKNNKDTRYLSFNDIGELDKKKKFRTLLHNITSNNYHKNSETIGPLFIFNEKSRPQI